MEEKQSPNTSEEDRIRNAIDAGGDVSMLKSAYDLGYNDCRRTLIPANVGGPIPKFDKKPLHHVCDSCGAEGPEMGKNERIMFWLCDVCLKNA